MLVENLARLRSLLELAICELLNSTLRPEIYDKTSPFLDRLADWLVSEGGSGRTVTVVTTNYDFVLEDAVCRRLRFAGEDIERVVDYGFSWRSTATGQLRHRPDRPLVRFLRLHGAVNWLRCRMCEFIYVNQRGPVFHQPDRSRDDGGNTCHCSALRLQRVIVAPSIVQKMEDADLQIVWKAALEELRLSSRWNILGYSMPNEDVAVRSIFIRALRGRQESPEIRVFERNASLENRFRLLLGHLRFVSSGVEEYISGLPEPHRTA
jgi:hypothetical protein